MIADPVFATQVQRDTDVQSDPTILSITSEGINKDDTLGAAVSDLLMPFAGAFIGKPAEGLKEDVLVKSSTQAGLVDTALLQAGGDAIRKDLKSANTAYPIAIRLSGKFKTAFPDGKPENKSATAEPSPSPAASPSAKEAVLKEAKSEGVVILVGDSDFAYDSIAGRAQQVLAQMVFVPSNGNLNFIQSSVEQLAGDSDLIGIRSRSSGNRPFVVVNKMEAAAQQKYQSKIDELEDNLNQARQNLAALQTTSSPIKKRFFLQNSKLRSKSSRKTRPRLTRS